MAQWDRDLEIDPAEVRRAAGSPAGWRLLGTGWDCDAWLADESVVWRVPRREIAIEPLRREAEIMPIVAPLLPLPVPVPRLIDGHDLPVLARHDYVPGRELAGLVYRYSAWVRSSTSQGTAKLRIQEYKNSTGVKVGEGTSAPVTLSPEWQLLTLDYTTKGRETTLDFQVRDFPLVPSESFETDEIAVRNVTGQPGTGVVDVPQHLPERELRSRVVPSPIHSWGTLSFATSRSGGLRVEVLDLAGRRVRRLLDRADAPAGRHELSIPRDLEAGVYFYRIEARERVETGRFAVLR